MCPNTPARGEALHGALVRRDAACYGRNVSAPQANSWIETLKAMTS